MSSWSEPTIGEIRLFAGIFAPKGWKFCEGQLLAIRGNEALFTIVSNYYGGDARTTFALPDLRDRAPVANNGTEVGSLNTLGAGETRTIAMNYIICLDGVYPGRS